MTDNVEYWGNLYGEEIFLLTLTDEISVNVSNYGGTITSIKAPDRFNELAEVVLGFNSLDGYLKSKSYQGATIGRFANRISEGVFQLTGNSYQLHQNDGINHLHGGYNGFNKKIWNIEEFTDSSLCLYNESQDGEEGYPGTLDVKIQFSVYRDKLEITYSATTDKPTIVNLTNHVYFNLSGSKTILNHHLCIDADYFIPIDKSLIPLGPFDNVENSPFDFRENRRIGEKINQKHIQLIHGKGYDHNFILNNEKDPQIILTDQSSGRALEISTTMPGVQLYTGNFLDGSEVGRDGALTYRSGLCLETQYFPDSPNRPEYPSTTLLCGEKYFEKTVYRFNTEC